MKRVFVCMGLLLATNLVLAQPNPPGSPPVTATVTIAGKTISINYNSPRVNGREGHIFNKGGLISRPISRIRFGVRVQIRPRPCTPMPT